MCCNSCNHSCSCGGSRRYPVYVSIPCGSDVDYSSLTELLNRSGQSDSDSGSSENCSCNNCCHSCSNGCGCWNSCSGWG